MSKPNQRLRVVTAAFTFSLVALLLCGCTDAKTADFRVCDAFAYHVREAGTVKAMDRIKVLEAMENVQGSENVGPGVAESLSNLRDARLRSGDRWSDAATSLARACQASGYDPHPG